MRKVGITGGIGAGKSEVTDYLLARGYTVVDADELAREATAPGQPALREIRAAFGDGVFVPKPEAGAPDVLDRKALAEVVFADADARARLEAIVHREVEQRIREADYGGQKLVFFSIPLLFETQSENEYDEVWLVTADEDIRIERACARDGESPEAIRSRIKAQMPESEKRARADIIIENNGSIADLKNQIESILSTHQ
ncbi:MAG: dephospho-CoA kinase [Clostridiales Family XIII bacterium]|nr:dephospho-CoA kinase [Clostridiales Family XIII bacterium]